MKKQKNDIEEILKAYLECSLWTEEERMAEEIGIGGVSIFNFDQQSKEEARNEIISFLDNVGEVAYKMDNMLLGHDIWLTRNNHGAGFFDRGYDKDVEAKLTDSALELGESVLYVGADGMLYFEKQ